MSEFSDKVKRQLGSASGPFSLVPKPTKKDKTRQNVAHTRLDETVWKKARYKPEIADGIRELYEGDRRSTYVEDPETGQRLERHEGRPAYDNAPELLQDLYYTLFKTSPYLHDLDAVEPDAHLNREILEELRASPRYDSLHDKTAMDEVISSFATTKFLDHIKEILERADEAAEDSNRIKDGEAPVKVRIVGETDEEPPPPGPDDEPLQPDDEPIDVLVNPNSKGGGGGQQIEVVEDLREDPSEPEDSEDDGNESPQDGETDKGEGQPTPNTAGGQGEDPGERDDEGEAETESQPEPESFREALDEAGFQAVIDQALEEVGDDVRELDEIRQGIGLDTQEWRQMDPAVRFKLVELLQTPQMKTLADMMGRMTRFAMGQQASRIVNVPHEVYDVGLGDEMKWLLQSEFASLAPALRADFYQRFADKQLNVYKLRGKEDAGKGPIIAGCDRSGSMGMNNNQPMNWAIAVVESLRRICHLQKRDFDVSFFDSQIVREFAFPQGKVDDWNEVMDMLSVAPGGGTVFMTTLDTLMAKVTTSFDVGGETRADIVFVTDGAAHLHDDWLERFLAEKERVGCRVWGIFIGGAGDLPSNSRPLQTLESFSDVVVNVNELKHDSLRDVFSGV